MLSNPFISKPEFEIFDMEPADCRDVSRLHGERFAQPWGDGEFHTLLSQHPVFGHVARQTNRSQKLLAGFVLTRAVGDEAEILSIGVSLRHKGAGLGWRLMQAAIRQARHRGANCLFLEVDEINAPALALYRKSGFAQVGERRAYYQDSKGNKTAALVMRLDLG